MIDASAFYDPALPWTGRADLLRTQRAGVALITELGRNYDTYHDDLAARLTARGRPAPEQFKTMRAFMDAWAEVQAIVRAENLLRIAQTVASGGEIKSLADRPPLVGPDDRLLSVSEGAALTATSP